MIVRRLGLSFLAAILMALLLAASAAAASPAGVVEGAAPTLVPHSQLPGAGALEGPVHTVAGHGIQRCYRQFGHGPDRIMVQGDTAPMSLWMPYLLHPLARH